VERDVKLTLAVKQPPEEPRPPSIIRRVMVWARNADAGDRADAASALGRAYRYSNLPEEMRSEAVIGMTAMLDDRSILVRRALAEALASADNAPRHIVSALANDQPEIAAIMVARSPLLTEADLVDCAAVGDETVQIALARRAGMTIGVAAALAEIGRREAVVALLENREAPLTAGALRRIAERFGEDAEAREALLARPWLPAALRCDLVGLAANALFPLAAAFGLGEERIDRLMREAREVGAMTVARNADTELVDLVRHLRASGALTIALLIRSLASGHRAFFEAAAAELSGHACDRVAAFVRAPHGAGFAALYRRMDLPAIYFAPICAALGELNASSAQPQDRLLRPVISRAVEACESAAAPGLDRLASLLRRLEAEAAIEEAREIARSLAEEEAVDENARFAPLVSFDDDDRQEPPLMIAINDFGEVELLPTAIEALAIAVAA
jgi:uncharacterized protein (DUF2336 family)